LTRAYDLPCLQRVEAGCPDCKQAETTISK